MTTLAKDSPRAWDLGNVNELPVVASDIIYEGAAVGMSGSTGNARPLVAADVFAGFAESQADNSAGLAGAVRVRVIKRGAAKLTVVGASATSIGAKVYASDDDTFTLTATSNSYIGRVIRCESGEVCIVEFDATLSQVA